MVSKKNYKTEIIDFVNSLNAQQKEQYLITTLGLLMSPETKFDSDDENDLDLIAKIEMSIDENISYIF